jgi:excisionase family DNA binding protein
MINIGGYMTHFQVTKEEKNQLLKAKGQNLPEVLVRFINALIKNKGSDSAVTIDESVDELITPNDAASLLGVSRPYIMKLIKDGSLYSFPVGTHHKLKRTDVLKFKKILEGHHKESYQKFNASSPSPRSCSPRSPPTPAWGRCTEPSARRRRETGGAPTARTAS